MAKLNYHFARRERERVRKVRQQEKLQRRSGHDSESTASAPRIDAPAARPESNQAERTMQPESGT